MSGLFDAIRDAAKVHGYYLVEHEYRDRDPEGCDEYTIWLQPISVEVSPDERT